MSAPETLPEENPTSRATTHPEADPEFLECLNTERLKNNTLVFKSRYMTSSPYTKRILNSLMSDLTLTGTSQGTGWANGDLFERVFMHSRSVFALKSAMGTGKTTLLKRYLQLATIWERRDEVVEKPLVIVIVVSRVALGLMYIDQLRDLGFVFYKDETPGQINADRVICTPESYYRLKTCTKSEVNVFKDVDILILDEFVTFLASLDSKTMANRRGLFYSIFQEYFFSDNTQVLIMDACLSPSSMGIIERLVQNNDQGALMPAFEKMIYVIYNCARPALPGQIRVVDSLYHFKRLIFDAVHVCITKEWENLRQMAILNKDNPDYKNPDPEYQIVIAHASINKQKCVHQELITEFSNYLTESNCVMVNSESGGENMRTSDWLNKYVIEHTSTIAAGSDYNPPRAGRTIFVFSYTYEKIPAPLMAQMTFRARLPIVHTVTFFVQRQTARDTPLCTDRETIIREMEKTSSFMDVPYLSNDRSIYKLMRETVDGMTCIVTRLNRLNFGLDVAVDQMICQNKALNDYGAYLIQVLSDMSDEWNVVREGGLYEREIGVKMSRDDIKAMRSEQEAGGVFKEVEFQRSFALFLDNLDFEKRTPINDMIKQFDQQDPNVRARSTNHTVFVYEVLLMFKMLNISFMPSRSENAVIQAMDDFVHLYKGWFRDNYDFYKCLALGTKDVNKSSISDYLAQKESMHKVPQMPLRVFYTLLTLSAIYPQAVEIIGDDMRLRPLYSSDPASPFYWNPTGQELHTGMFRDAEKFPIIELSDTSPDVYNYIFREISFPKALSNNLWSLCDPEMAPDPAKYKKSRAIVSDCTSRIIKKVCDMVGYKLISRDGKRTWNVVVPWQTAKVSVRCYTIDPTGSDIAMAHMMAKTVDSIRKGRDSIATIDWGVLQNETKNWPYQIIWTELA